MATVLYPAIKHPNDGVVFLRTTFPTAESVISEESTETVNISSVALKSEAIDNEARLIAALQKDDIDIAYDKLDDKDSWHVVHMRVTGYCSCRKCCGNFSDGKTASSHRIKKGDVFVAADKHFCFGTEMIIPGYNQTQTVKVLDRGRVIKGNRLDVYFDSHKKANEWGVQYLDVLVKAPN